ncbi:MAG: glycosyltransferase [Thermoleophilia bacterium]|nr:glycosyltransferase [Thermoleophilia bacterium]MDH4339971.1 glycosyltransferase [Thermoleophilia bacterium]
MTLREAVRAAVSRIRRVARAADSVAATEVDRARHRRDRADLALFHEFAPPPYGGGNQFLLALKNELERRGLEIELNRISGATTACLVNSFNFDFRRLRRFDRPGCRVVHRVDGPIGAYRGFDDGTDDRIAAINADLADATIVQSRFSLEGHRSLGIELRDPVVVHNSVDGALFYPPQSREPLSGRKVRLIATSWSDNPNKGGETFEWLGRNLDWRRFELTLLGRFPGSFQHARVLAPVASSGVADELRQHDLYIAASRNDPCSNALLEALACGLPVAYLNSGGHPELVGDGGLPFARVEEIPEVLERLAREIDDRRASIRVSPLSEVADRYLEVLGVSRSA